MIFYTKKMNYYKIIEIMLNLFLKFYY